MNRTSFSIRLSRVLLLLLCFYPAAIYGPDNNIHDMETAMFLRLRRGLPILVLHEGLVTTSYGHVDDLCRNLLEMARLPATAGEIVNTTGGVPSARAWTELLAGIVGVEADIVEVPTGFTDARPVYGHLFGVKHHGTSRRQGRRPRPDGRARHPSRVRGDLRVVLREPPRRRPRTPAPSDPLWGTGYDFALEVEVAAALRSALMEDRVPEAVVRQAIRTGLPTPRWDHPRNGPRSRPMSTAGVRIRGRPGGTCREGDVRARPACLAR